MSLRRVLEHDLDIPITPADVIAGAVLFCLGFIVACAMFLSL